MSIKQKIKFFIQSLETPERLEIINKNRKLFPEFEIFKSINGYNIEETCDEFYKSGYKFHNLRFKTFGTLANWLTKVKAIEYQVKNNIEYLVLIEDDLLLKEHFIQFIINKIPRCDRRNFLRLAKWGEGYVFSLKGAKEILEHMKKNGIIKNIDDQLEKHCGKEEHTVGTPWSLVIGTNNGDCLKTETISDDQLEKFKNHIPK